MNEEFAATGSSRFVAMLRSIGGSVIAGVIAGAIGGLVSRIAMRVIAVAAGPLAQGQLTENGNRVGDITAGGTLALVAFGALFFGIAGGLVYAVVRDELERFGSLRGLVFGVATLLVFGGIVINFDNEDFRRFASPSLGVGMFAAVFVVFGLFMPLLDDAIHPRSVRSTSWPTLLLAAAASGVAALFVLGVLGRTGGHGGPGSVQAAVFLYLVVAVPLLRRYVRNRPWLLFAPAIAGAAATVIEVARVLRA